MPSALIGRLRRLLQRPMFGTVVIPAGARVDPGAFPEAQFPLWCPDCGYALRGLSSTVCPECGRPFDRGLLLVDEYVRLKHVHRRSRVGRWAYRLCWAVLAILGLQVLFAALDHFYGGALSQHPFVRKYNYVPLAMLGAMDFALFVVLIVLFFGIRTQRTRQRAVRAALAAVPPDRRPP